MDRETVINLPKKIFKFVIAYKVGKKVYCVSRKIYTMVPKFDKITGIDTEILIDNCKGNQ